MTHAYDMTQNLDIDALMKKGRVERSKAFHASTRGIASTLSEFFSSLLNIGGAAPRGHAS